MVSAVDKRTTRLQLRFFNNCFEDDYSTRKLRRPQADESQASHAMTLECNLMVNIIPLLSVPPRTNLESGQVHISGPNVLH